MSESGTNVFIDLSIIQKSNLKELIQELDILIATGKKIYLWSKTVEPFKMEYYCKSIKVDKDPKELEIHNLCHTAKKEGLTYKDISEKYKVPVNSVGFYVNSDPNRQWVLDDWITEYVKKDSSMYPKVDIIIDPDEKIINRFKSAGIEGHIIDKV